MGAEQHRPAVGHQRALAFHETLRRHRHHPPQQGVERHRHREPWRVLQPHRRQAVLRLSLDHALGDQRPAQVGAAQRQPGQQRVPRQRPSAREPRHHAGDQQPHRIHRVDDEHARPHHRRRGQRPQQLGAVDGEGIQQRMGDQGQLDRPEPASWRLRHPALAKAQEQPPDRRAQQRQHQQRMAQAAVQGHARHRVVGEQHDRQRIQVRQGTQRGAGQQRGATMVARSDGGGDGRAEDDLGQ